MFKNLLIQHSASCYLLHEMSQHHEISALHSKTMGFVKREKSLETVTNGRHFVDDIRGKAFINKWEF